MLRTLFIEMTFTGVSVSCDEIAVDEPPTKKSSWPATSAWRALPSPSKPVTVTLVMPSSL